MTASSFAFALRRLRRGWRSGELRVLMLALTLAAAAAVAVGLFTERVQRALENGTSETFGADALITAHDPPSPELLERLRGIALRAVAITEFPSVVVDGERTQLASIKAVQEGYPLRGQVSLRDDLVEAARKVQGVPPPGEVWVEPRLWSVLGLERGAHLQIGVKTFTVTALIADEPGRGGAFAELAPEALINADDLAATQLIGPGSRITYRLQLAGAPTLIAAAAKIALPPGARFTTPQDARPDIKETLKRARRFLNLAVLATLLLAASAVALSARQHAAQLRDEVALLKCLGARHAFMTRALIAQMLMLGLIAGGAGAVLGAAIQTAAASLAAPALGVALPPPSPWPVLAALLLVVLLLAGFALPPVLGAIGTPPVRVFQRTETGRAGTGWSAAAALITVGALLWLQAGDPMLAGYVLAGAGGTALLLALVALGLVRALSPLRARAGVAWRFGLANIARRRGAAVAQIVALGVAMLALLLVTVVREDMLDSWRNRLPPRTPNEFLINIQPAQMQPLRTFFAARGKTDLVLWPMVRARLTALNGKPVSVDSFEDPETRRWINREFNLSWTERFGDDNTLLQGQWWSAEARGQPWLSVDEYAVERLKLKLGDTLTLDVAGQSLTLSVRNVRKVRWDSFRPNFFLVTPPGVLDDIGAVQWITSFYLPTDDRTLLRDLVRELPNVTALDLDAALAQVRSIMDRIVHALEFILMFALLAGLIVMLAVIEGSRAERARETGVLRALGASSRVILRGLVAEYATLGLAAGLVASAGAQVLAWALATRVFEIPYGPRPLLWIVGAAAGCGIVALTGWLSLRGVLRTPPREVLAASG